ncbi:MAG: ferritin family protein [Candidatus Cloacimonetes bacterium]|nr:ferritin family protein [Candidatus Cloacimonadota bacterium]
MTIDKFNEIIDFAVSREKEAVEFYSDLQQKAKFSAQKMLLKEFENMEKGHIIILENIRKKGIVNFHPKEVKDLKISDYLVEMEPTPDMNYQDILVIAMKKEEAARDLYSNMAAEFSGSDLENLFERLASEEAQHKLHFEKLYDEEILKDN